jgi:hypothetical protein
MLAGSERYHTIARVERGLGPGLSASAHCTNSAPLRSEMGQNRRSPRRNRVSALTSNSGR